MKIKVWDVKRFLSIYFAIFIISGIFYSIYPSLGWILYPLSAITVIGIAVWLFRGLINKK